MLAISWPPASCQYKFLKRHTSFAVTLCGVSAPLLSSSHCPTSTPLTSHLAPSCSAQNVCQLTRQRARVYCPMELNSLSNRAADIYVLWLFQPLPANYPADQSVAQPASCFHPLWQFVSQACCSATDAVGVRAPLCCSWKSAVM